MKLFRRSSKDDNPPATYPDLVYASPKALEDALDGSDHAFHRYFYVLYHISPDDDSDINARRTQLRLAYPENTIPVGKYFVLNGKAAFNIVSEVYQSLAKVGSPIRFREYAASHHQEIVRRHEKSQSLPHPINLTEAQLIDDENLNFFATLALSSRQFIPRT